jgi:hypothetical protein
VFVEEDGPDGKGAGAERQDDQLADPGVQSQR